MAKKVAVINDLSGFGRCSLTAAIPVLSVMGVQCCPLTTAVLTGQSGYKEHYCTDLTDMMPEYKRCWQLNKEEFNGIYTGYVTGEKQINFILEFLEVFRKKDTFLLVDPVMGDDGSVYGIYSGELLEGMRTLTRKANLITPNLMEACLLNGTSYDEVMKIKDISERLDFIGKIGKSIIKKAETTQDIVITGIKCRDKNNPKIYNMLISKDGICSSKNHFYEKSFSGTGDLMASCLCGARMSGKSTYDSMKLAEKFLSKSIADTMSDVNCNTMEGVNFEKNLSILF